MFREVKKKGESEMFVRFYMLRRGVFWIVVFVVVVLDCFLLKYSGNVKNVYKIRRFRFIEYGRKLVIFSYYLNISGISIKRDFN